MHKDYIYVPSSLEVVGQVLQFLLVTSTYEATIYTLGNTSFHLQDITYMYMIAKINDWWWKWDNVY